MKKLIAMLLAVAMVAAVAAGCTAKEEKKDVPASALEVLEKIWNGVAEDQRFPVMGGDFENPVDGAPGKFNLADAENATYSLLIPVEQLDNVDEAASLVHAMMANNFTCGVFHVKDAAKAEGLAKAMEDAVKNNQWMCGMPESAIVAVIGGEYVLMAYGINDALTPFETQLDAAYPDAQKTFDGALA